MPSYKLTYFNIMGRAEVARLMFALAGQDYEDNRVEFKDWPKMKPNTMLGFLPELEVDDFKVSQCMTINRYLAKKLGLEPKGGENNRVIGEMIADTCLNIMDSLQPMLFIKDENEKKQKVESYMEKQYKSQVGNLEKYVPEDDSFIFGDISWVDLVVYQTSNWFGGLPGLAITESNFPKLRRLADKVQKNGKIAEWIEKRPKSDY